MTFRRKDDNDDGGDFSLGTIAGLEEAEKLAMARPTPIVEEYSNTGDIEIDENFDLMQAIKGDNEERKTSRKRIVPSDEADIESKAKISFKNTTYNFEIAEIIVNSNPNINFFENNDVIEVSGEYIRFSRSQAEAVLGKITDIAWRMLVMNNKGDKQVFNDYELILGTAKEVTEQIETSQLNIRISKEAKENLDKYRALLVLTQGEFVEKAIEELVSKIKDGVI